jgi:hypothetical protein
MNVQGIITSLNTFLFNLIMNREVQAFPGRVRTITTTAGNMFQINVEVGTLASERLVETYIVNDRAEAEELVAEMRARKYIVEVSEIKEED